ncbi:HemK family protein methyltransferase [Patescibacteria group bacterium]|nr:HemK family protein methyltransferase [Patescibacteria group bacterium]
MSTASEFQHEIRWLLDEKYQGKLSKLATEDIARLKRGEHIDYLIGFGEFLGCKIDLSKRPHIPRPETEYWTQRAIIDIKKSNRKNIRVLDVFSGSGCIGVAVLKHISSATLDFTEKDREFCKQITMNTRLNNINPSRYNIIQSDIFNNISESLFSSQFLLQQELGARAKSVTYDYILANPPYVPERNRKSVQQSVLDNEPLEAIFGGKDGLQYIKKFLKEAKNHLKKNGRIYLEFDSIQRDQIPKLLKEYGYSNFEMFRDQYHKWRFLVIKK